ncbi:MAG: hypothetical protein ACR2IE_09985 [Candidatus Sumerlaeaceae bacterium]
MATRPDVEKENLHVTSEAARTAAEGGQATVEFTNPSQDLQADSDVGTHSSAQGAQANGNDDHKDKDDHEDDHNDPTTNREALTKAPTKTVTDLVEYAKLLISYAIRNQIEIPADAIDSIILADQELQAGQPHVSNISSVVQAYGVLQKQVPISIQSLQDCSADYGVTVQHYLIKAFEWPPGIRVEKYMCSKADQTIRNYRSFSYLCLFLLLIVQAYYSYGEILLRDLMPSLPKGHTRAVAGQSTADDAALPLSATPVVPTFDDAIARIVKQKSNFYILERWSVPLQRLRIIPGLDDIKKWNLIGKQSGTAVSDDEIRTAFLIAAHNALTLIQGFFLPLLYGLLGAVVFILRETMEMARLRTFRYDMKAYQISRVALGGIVGVAVGWFFQFLDTGNLGVKITSLALSFLAGYNVEVLFALLDKLNIAFSSAPLRKS